MSKISVLVLMIQVSALSLVGGSIFNPRTRLETVGFSPMERSAADIAVLPDGNVVVSLRESGASGPAGIAFYRFFDELGRKLDPPIIETTFYPDPGVGGGISCDPQGRRCYVAISKNIGTLVTQGTNAVFVLNVEESPPRFVTRVDTGGDPFGPADTAVDPSGRFVYASVRGSNYVPMIHADPDSDSYQIQGGFTSFGQPVALAVARPRVGQESGQIYAVNRVPTITCSDQNPGPGDSTIDLTVGPTGSTNAIVIDHNSSLAYVAYREDPRVGVVDISGPCAQNSQIGTIGLPLVGSRSTDPMQPVSLDLAAQGEALFVSGHDSEFFGWLNVFDLGPEAPRIVQKLRDGNLPVSIAYSGREDQVLFSAQSRTPRRLAVLGSLNGLLASPIPDETIYTDSFEDQGLIDRTNLHLKAGDPNCIVFDGWDICKLFGDPNRLLILPQLSTFLSTQALGPLQWARTRLVRALGLEAATQFMVTVDSRDSLLRPTSLIVESRLEGGEVRESSARAEDEDADGIVDGFQLEGPTFLPTMEINPSALDVNGDDESDFISFSPLTGVGNSLHLPLADTNGDGVPDSVAPDLNQDGSPDPGLPFLPFLAGLPNPEIELKLHFAQFGDGVAGGADILSQIRLFNLDPSQPAQVKLLLKNDDGDPLSVDLNGELVQGEKDLVIPAGGLIVLSTDGVGPLTVGSVTVCSDRAVAGVILFGGSAGLAGVGTSAVFDRGFTAPVQTETSQNLNTGIALMNLENAPLNLQLSLCDSENRTLATADLMLAAMGHRAIFADRINWQPSNGVVLDFSDFSGLIKVSAEGAVAATVLQTRRTELVTTPVAGVVIPAGSSVASHPAGPIPDETELAYDLYFAQFGDGSSGSENIRSQIILFGLTAGEAQVRVQLKDGEGNPLSVDLEGEVVPGEKELVIPAGALRILGTDGEGPLQVGSVRILSDRAVAGFIIFSGSAGSAGVGGSTLLRRGFESPMQSDGADGINTGIAVTNLETEEQTIQLGLFDSQGTRLATASLVLAGMGHRAIFLDRINWNPEPGVQLDFSSFEGLLKAQVGGKSAATVIRSQPGVFATQPVSPSLD